MKRWWTGAGLSRADLALPAVLVVVGVAEVLLTDVPRAVAATTTVLACALLVGRRRLPATLATAACLVVVLQGWLGVDDEDLVAPLGIIFAGCYALGRHARTVPGVAGLLLVDAAVHVESPWTLPAAQDVLWVGVLTVGPWLFGRLVRSHALANEELAAQGRRLVEEQRELAERAVADERRRIARELHDVIAHSLSVMVVQAGAAESALRTDPDTAERGLQEIQRAGRTALDETGRLLHLLRDTDEPDLAPQPSAAQLPDLVEVFRAAGLDVDLVLDGSTDGLPAGVDLSVYRIVQEGLTNVLKHAPGTAVQVGYHRRPDGVDVDLRSGRERGMQDGQPDRHLDRQLGLASTGRGLVGMRERVAVFGGDLDAATTDDGGYVVRARLPLITTT
jgi:signal transduction histidine kinase